MYTPTAQDIRLLQQSNINLYAKIELLDYSYKIQNSLEGYLVSDNISITKDSGVRRTYSLTVRVADDLFLIARDKVLWFNRIIRPYVGIKDNKTGKIVWYRMGTFILTDNTVTYDETTYQMTINCSDLMCLYNGDRGSQMNIETIYASQQSPVAQYVIEAGQDVRTVIVGVLTSAGITNYYVDEIVEEIPYDLEFGIGSTVFDVLNRILELFTGWEMFFDVDGRFIWQKISTCLDDKVILTNDIMKNLIVSEASSNDFKTIYNKTIVWGKTIDVNYYTETVTSSDGKFYYATIDLGSAQYEYRNFDKVGLKIPRENKNYPYININSLGNVPICDDSGMKIKVGQLKADTVYVFKYRSVNPKGFADFYLLGQYQPYGEYTETDANCLFSTTNTGEVIQQVMQFDEIYSDDLARQRAEYETYLSCKLTDSMTLNTLPIYWLDINHKITYTPAGEIEPIQYLISSISGSSTDTTMTITMSKFYEDYYVYYNKKYADVTEETITDDDIMVYDMDIGFLNNVVVSNLLGTVTHKVGEGLMLQAKYDVITRTEYYPGQLTGVTVVHRETGNPVISVPTNDWSYVNNLSNIASGATSWSASNSYGDGYTYNYSGSFYTVPTYSGGGSYTTSTVTVQFNCTIGNISPVDPSIYKLYIDMGKQSPKSLKISILVNGTSVSLGTLRGNSANEYTLPPACATYPWSIVLSMDKSTNASDNFTDYITSILLINNN